MPSMLLQHLISEGNENLIQPLESFVCLIVTVDELANVKRHLYKCRVKPNVRSDNFKQDVDDRADARKVGLL